jgi:lysophospholipase L1-like esterase
VNVHHRATEPPDAGTEVTRVTATKVSRFYTPRRRRVPPELDRCRTRAASVRPVHRWTYLCAALFLVAATLFALPAAYAAAGDGSPSDPNIRFVGRWDTANPAAVVPGFAGAYYTTGFTGTTVKLKQRNAIDLYYSIDGGADVYIQNVSGTVNLTPTALRAGNHTLRVSYRVVAGSYHGDAVFQGLVLDSGARTYALPRPAALLEFVGDSITVGTTSSKNALTAYGWLTGEALGADHTQIAQGGGCLVSAADGCVGIADAFLRVSAVLGSAQWDFNRYRADAVIINLGTNDVGHGVTGAAFQSRYVQLLADARARYPQAQLYALRTFTGRYATETRAAVDARTAAGDTRVRFVDTTGWLASGDLSDSVHPNDTGHRHIAERLAPILRANLPTASPSPTASATASPSRSASVSAAPAGGCAVRYAVTSQWQGGFQGDVTVRNTGSAAIAGWTLRWNFAAGQSVGQAWNATVSQSGTAVSAVDAGWNGSVPSGGSTTFGFTGAWTGSNPVPAAFTLNGTACTAEA